MITMGKKFKKSMAMAMATAMALSVPALPVYQTEKVEAAEQKVAEYTSALAVNVYEDGEYADVYFPYEVLEADPDVESKNNTLYYAVTTLEKDGKTPKWPKESAYEAMGFNGGASIDLSWVNRKKEQVLCVSTGPAIDEIKPVTVVLKAQDTLMATYSGTLDGTKGNNVIGNSDEGYLTFETGTKKEPKAVSAAAIEYRTTNGDWKKVAWTKVVTKHDKEVTIHGELPLEYYSAKGATLQMRVAPNDETQTPASKIINVKIKAKGKAPSVKVDYNDKTVSVPAKVEYSIDYGTTWKKASADGKKATVNIGDYGWNGDDPVTVYYRTQGDAKKSASKIKYLTIKPEDTTFTSLVAPVSGAATIEAVPAAGSGKIDVRYKTAYDSASGLVFTNATDDMYQVAYAKKADIKDYMAKDGITLVAASSSAIVAKAAKKVTWATVSAQTRDKTSNAPTKVGSGKLSLKKGEKLEDYVILYRICDKKGEKVNSETRIFEVPGIVKQSVVLEDDSKKAVDTVKIVSGAATEGTKTVTLTVSASGITSTKASYKVGAYTDVACTTKYSDLTASYKDGKLTVANKAKTAKNTYYVKVSVEGTSTVLKVVVE